MLEGPEFRHLSSFLAVAEECNFRKAAERLRLAQPSLTVQIQQLESRIGAVLFRRTPAGTSLTRAGRSLVPYAKEMLRLRELSVRDASAVHSGKDLPLRFGFSQFVRRDLVEDALRGYRDVVPGGIVESSSHSPEALATLVTEGQLDAALTTLPVRRGDLRMKTVCAEKMLICLRQDDPLACQQSLSKDDVQRRLRVFYSQDAQPLLYDELSRQFGLAGIQIKPSSFVSSPIEMQWIVKANGELGLLPESATVDAELVLREITAANIRMKTGFLWNSEQQNPSFPLLVYRLIELCPRDAFSSVSMKKPCGSVGVSETVRSDKTA